MFNEFTNYNNNTSKNNFNLIQKARRDLIGEIQAIIDYDDNLHSSDNMVANKIWEDIKNEELIHIGKLLALLNFLDPTQKMYVIKGIEEFNQHREY